MPEHRRRPDQYIWIPKHERIKFPPRRPDYRTALYYIIFDMQEYYFVNNTDKLIKRVHVSSGGFLTADDDVFTRKYDDYSYDDVQPGKAILIDTYDPYDDFKKQWSIDVEVDLRTLITFRVSPPRKMDELVLSWDTSEPGKHVQMRIDEAGR